MNGLKLLLFLIVAYFPNCTVGQFSSFPIFGCVIQKKHITKKKKPRIRWKRVFRPIKIFKKKISFWLSRFIGLMSVIGLVGYISDQLDTGLSGRFIEIVVGGVLGIFAIAAFATILILLALPIIIIVRIFKELKWGKRMRRCYDF